MRNDPTARALQLLSLLQTHRLWRGAELAARLDVTERTIRRDVDRLRDLEVQQELPDRLRRRVSALDASIVSLRRSHGNDGIVDPETLSVLASACRSHEEVRFDYQRSDGDDSRRLVQPHQLLSAGRLWYLIAWDLRRTDWRTFRLDRLSAVQLAGGHFAPRDIPGGDAAAYLAASVASIPREIETRSWTRARSDFERTTSTHSSSRWPD